MHEAEPGSNPARRSVRRIARSVHFLSLLLAAACAGPPPAIPARNVLFLMGDDHAAYALGCYGSPVARTPHLDRLAAEGVRFTRAFVNTPFCTPSRQSLLTGRLPHAIGVTLLQTPLAEETLTLADHLQARGFATGAVGKMHFNSRHAHGFDTRVDIPDYEAHRSLHPGRPVPADVPVKPPWRPFKDPARVWLNADALPVGAHDEDSLGTFLARRAVDFLREHRGDRFCLWVSFYEPHSPFNFPIEYAGRFDPVRMPLPEPGPADARWVPAIFRGLSDADKRGIVAAYYTSVEYLDKNIGLVLGALRELGLEEDTLVVYAGDHGYLLGHHGRFEKHSMWEECVRAPLIARQGRRFGPGRAADAMVEFVDVAPTILEALSVPPMPDPHGRSFLNVLDGRASRHRDAVFSEYLVDNCAMIRTERWKYVYMTGKADLGLGYATGEGAPGVTHRLYDLARDPGETRNLAGEPQHRDMLERLQHDLLRRFQDTDPRAARLPAGLSIEDALAWFCEPPEGGR